MGKTYCIQKRKDLNKVWNSFYLFELDSNNFYNLIQWVSKNRTNREISHQPGKRGYLDVYVCGMLCSLYGEMFVWSIWCVWMWAHVHCVRVKGNRLRVHGCVWNALDISISIDVWLNVWSLMHLVGFGNVYELQPAWHLCTS